MTLQSIMIDSREPSWVQQLQFDGASKAVVMLDAGDFLCACDDGQLLAIERKTSGDLLNTLRDDRLFPQITRLREVTPWAYLVITGVLHPGRGGHCVTEERESGWNWASVAGALATVQEMGVCVVQAASDLDFEATVLRLANRGREQVRVAPARDVTIVTEREQVLAALPGIGPDRARSLLSAFTPAFALDYLTAPAWKWSTEHPAVAGIGPGTRAKVRRAMGLAPNQALEVVEFDKEPKYDGDTSADDVPANNPLSLGDGQGDRAGNAPVPAVRS